MLKARILQHNQTTLCDVFAVLGHHEATVCRLIAIYVGLNTQTGNAVAVWEKLERTRQTRTFHLHLNAVQCSDVYNSRAKIWEMLEETTPLQPVVQSCNSMNDTTQRMSHALQEA